MGYSTSQIDRNNINWFSNDRSRKSLVGIKVSNGNIRGVFPCQIDFSYPISAFVGENGSGKSTLLALAACAFHNNDTFHQFSRKKSYYTYGDFFTFSPKETGLHGIEIIYTIRLPSGDKPTVRRKKPSGKWTDFNTREFRNVVYLGINRIVPPSESSAHRSYKKFFEAEELPANLLSKIKTYLSRIFGKSYSSLRIFSHRAYRLCFVERNKISYSGFNMGAGENAVITILLDLLSAGPGALLVIDEIELGLHAGAQREFILVLKEICRDIKCQIICSTHSNIVLGALPPQARFFIQNKSDQTIIMPEISVEYAFGKLAGQNTDELNVFVEDEVGKAIIMNILPQRLRERATVYVIGSDQAILKQIAAHYREMKLNFIAFLDGDKRSGYNQQIIQIKRHLETRIDDETHFQTTITQRLQYLPGDTWPELSILNYILSVPNRKPLSERWDVPEEDIQSFLEQSLTSGKHNEFYHLSELLSMDEVSVRNDCIKFFKISFSTECNTVCDLVDDVLRIL